MSVWVGPFTAVYSGSVTLTECVNLWLEASGKKQNAVAKAAGISDDQIVILEILAAGLLSGRL
jgi:hypothetical protein